MASVVRLLMRLPQRHPEQMHGRAAVTDLLGFVGYCSQQYVWHELMSSIGLLKKGMKA